MIVVESPATARTLAKYLGPEYRAFATRGHVSDLPARAGSVKPEDGFAMAAETGRGAARTLGAIARALRSAETLVLATDPDREGEAIAWQVLSWLEVHGALGGAAVRRVAFHEVTPHAVRTALARPRDIDLDLVEAWRARRALDYLVGYGLSPVLWRKLPGCRSAGRVQSVALRLVCEREAAIEAFVARRYWTVGAEIRPADGAAFPAALHRLDGTAVGTDSPGPDGPGTDGPGADGPATGGLAAAALAEAAAGRVRVARFAVSEVARDTQRRPPPPPFTTATLQQEAARRLGFSIAETMAAAQRLYEGVELGGGTAGLITYMRTDSAAMATTAVAQARAEIRGTFGDAWLPAKPRVFRARGRNLQEAHEAVRPTDFTRRPEDLEPGPGGRRGPDRAAAALYGLIWRRALASQMAAARVERVRIEIASDDGGVVLAAAGAAQIFDGHHRVWAGATDGGDAAAGDADAGRADTGGAPPAALRTGDPVTVGAVRVEGHASRPPPRYTEAALVRRLDELGIGRPSTWAAILSVMQERGYAALHERRFVATERGRVATAFLEGFFGRWVDTGFTAEMEAGLDRIAAGARDRAGMLEDFWGPFDAALAEAGSLTRATVRAAIEARLDGFLFGPADATRRRCPACGKDTLELKLSRYGPFVGCGDWPDCDYRRSLAAAAADGDGYTGPRDLGTDPGTGLAVSLRRGPTGWYVQRGARRSGDREKAGPERMSLPPGVDPGDVDRALALRLLALPREVGRHPETGGPILAGIGRYGPWVRHGETWAAIPEGEDVLEVGINRAVALIADKEIRLSRARGPNRVLAELGRHPGDGAPVRIKTGHYGPFVAYRRRYVSLPKDLAPEDATLEDAVALLGRKDAGGG